MAIALFNDQDTLAGQKLGISTGKAFFLMIMASGLGAMNIYHMGNAITNKLLTPDSHLLLYALLYFIAGCIAFIEVPITEEIVTTEAKGYRATGHRLLLAVVACMAIGGGVYSITTDAEKSDAVRTAHQTSESSFDDLKKSLISQRNIARANATTTQERSQANSDYFTALSKLKIQLANHQSTRPPQAIETGSFWHWLWACGFSLLCSVGVIVITAYLTKYHKPLTEIPRVFFRVKEDQEWTMNDDDVRVIPAQVDLTGGSSTGAARNVLGTPSPTQKNEELTSPSERDAKNRPHAEDTRMGVVLNDTDSASERPLNEPTGRAVLVDYSEGHYGVIKDSILKREISPTQKPVKAQLVALNVKFVDDAARQQKAVEILDQLAEERVLILNPDYGKSGKVVAKYLLNTDYTELAQGSDKTLYTMCPYCGNEGTILESQLRLNNHGKVKCSNGHIFVAKNHLKAAD